MDIEITTGLCRCCYSEGSSKDLISTHHWMGTPEVYSQMLKECFDIELSNLDSNSNNICEVCVTQLRNASNFKKQVLQTESVFQKHLKSQAVKVETKLEDAEDAIEDYLGDDGAVDDAQSDYEMPIKNESVEEVSTKKRKAPASKKTKKKAKTEKAETSTKSAIKLTPKRLLRINDIKSMEGIQETKDKKTLEIEYHRRNMFNIMTFSNATPLKLNFGKLQVFGCAYCVKSFDKPSELKAHILKVHRLYKHKYLCRKQLYAYIGKLDITNLQCELCEMEIDRLETLMSHLTEDHKKLCFNQINSHILEFKFNKDDDVSCAICAQKFVKIKLLTQHMNTHYRNFMCTNCGSGFICESSLKCHQVIHVAGDFRCVICNKTFKTDIYKNRHIEIIHGGKLKNLCPYCNERFDDNHKKTSHMVKSHGFTAPVYSCKACDKSYHDQRILSRHTRRVHLVERKHECSKCDMKFFNSTSLQLHCIKHTGQRDFQCDYCSKKYGRKSTLREHIKIHANDRRFECVYCKQTFVQKCSLKMHLRYKHDSLLQE